MEIDGLFAHLVPCSKRVMAKNEQMTIYDQLGIVLHGCPAGRLRCRHRVIVADDQVFPAIQFRKQPIAVVATRKDEIAEMPDVIVMSNY